jgi:hypothetical protein
MNAFTAGDLEAGAFPRAGVGVRRADREPALVPPAACKCGRGKACGCRCCGPGGTAAATSVTCAGGSPGWRPGLPAAAWPPARGGAGWPAPGRPGRLRPGCCRAVLIAGILRFEVL